MPTPSCPNVYMHMEDESGQCACATGDGKGLEQIDVPMRIKDNILYIDLFSHNALPELPLADEIVAVRVHVRGRRIGVYPIYKSPIKTATVVSHPATGCICYI